jgi:hypothetical protein
MLRKLVLTVGLVMDGVGMILTLFVLQTVGNYLREPWPPIGSIIPQGMSFSDYMGLVTIPTGALLGFGFLLLAFGIIYPRQSTEPTPEGEAAHEDETGDEGEEAKA